ncbi:NAD-dependent epimerase/dehydratase family protein [Polynucleobacter sp. UB-Siik-W21]|uniref:NAD-dependent epimerase/dehydratase family protein n=1 Tax=Polynucleobacter sp. UB-Siik-W21 TaxID=1855646 RepID=UPI001BFEAB61|nr:NAD-dependent epimerase/dehydratase family protein [Polynucleobacter sp. UB-Siik-W21]QWD70725.1 NAD-dependent epimerase/dehydratase family protein [Polynucleobacter sp. UB-Siik-W21]
MKTNKQIIAVTGASGFVGSYLCKQLRSKSYLTIGLVRSQKINLDDIVVGDISFKSNWEDELSGVDTLVHCASRVHVQAKCSADTFEKYFLQNVVATYYLAKNSLQLGVKRFIYISSIKARNIEWNISDEEIKRIILSIDSGDFNNLFELNSEALNLSKLKNNEYYDYTKRLSEKFIIYIAKYSKNFDVVIVRPPLIYGEGVGGNFLRLIKLIKTIKILPFGLVKNRRSMISLDNFVDFLIHCINFQNLSNQIFEISDIEALSTPDLIRRLSISLGVKVILIPVPIWILIFLSKLAGSSYAISRLIDSLEVDNSKALNLTGWTPKYSVDDGLRAAALSSKSL